MTAPLNVGKVVLGAFIVPWWNKRAFGRALAIPLTTLATLVVSWDLAGDHLPKLAIWLLYFLHIVLFTLFAVTCHRLVLLNQRSFASVLLPPWTWRETRFIFFFFALWLVTTGIVVVALTLIANLWIPLFGEPGGAWFSWIAKIPMLYLFARFCLVFPATAVDRKVNLKWSWALTRRNGWRLFTVVAVLPWIISQVLDLLYRGDASTIEIVLLAFLASALLAVEVAALSLSYRELTRDEASVA